MIVDVRFKIALRLRAFLERWHGYQRRLPEFRAEIVRAATDYEAACSLRARFRDGLDREFPGCQIAITNHKVMLYLPNRYKNHQIPIIEPLPAELYGVAHPRGCSNAPF